MYTLYICYINQKTGELCSAHFCYGTAAGAVQNFRCAIKKSEVRTAAIYCGAKELAMWHSKIPC